MAYIFHISLIFRVFLQGRRRRLKVNSSVWERPEPIFLTCSIYTLIVDSHQPLLFSYSRHTNVFNILSERMNMSYQVVIRE